MPRRGMIYAKDNSDVGIGVFDDGFVLVRATLSKKRKLLFVTGGALREAAAGAQAVKLIKERIAALEHSPSATDAVHAANGSTLV